MSRAPLTLLGRLGAAPATVPLAAFAVLFAVGADDDAGYPLSYWYPAALLALGFVVVCALVLRLRLSELPRPLLAAGGFLLAFTGWSYLSIAWADNQGEAWDGANRTLLYLLVFVLFAAWRQRGETGATVLAVWIAGFVVLAAAVLLTIDSAADPLSYFNDNRLAAPAGYPNAAAALYLMPIWPALVLAGRRELWWWLRGLLAASVVLLADMALLTQSRGAVFSFPVVLLLYFVIVPGRTRSFAVLVPIAAAVGATTPTVLDVATRMVHNPLAPHGVAQPILIAAGVVALVVAGASWLEGRVPVSERGRRRANRVLAGLGIAGALALVVAGLVAAGDPVERVNHEWKSFKGGYGSTASGESRLTQGLGSNRYDFYRVALGSFERDPLLGVGTENFAQDYLRRGRSPETPRYPHSVELRTLSQTGIVGTVLLLGFLIAALAAILRAVRHNGGLAAAVAGGATISFLYWLVHGSWDWFWEIAGLGAPAFAMLGLACALAPRDRLAGTAEPRSLRRRAVWPVRIVAGLVALAALGSLTAPWLADLQMRRATGSWQAGQSRAYDRLDSAATLNPLSDRPSLISGTIALRVGELGRADRAFAEAIRRNPRSAYAWFERGAIASVLGRPAQAARLLKHAATLAPRDELTRYAVTTVRTGRRLDIEQLNNTILAKAQSLGGRSKTTR